MVAAKADQQSDRQPDPAASQSQSQKSFALSKPEFTQEGALSDLRDTRLSLEQVQQQAVNLFMEATRTLVTTSEPPVERSPQELSAKYDRP